jgi:hypothetical protein
MWIWELASLLVVKVPLAPVFFKMKLLYCTDHSLAKLFKHTSSLDIKQAQVRMIGSCQQDDLSADGEVDDQIRTANFDFLSINNITYKLKFS